MSTIIGRFGGDAAQQRAEDFAQEQQEKDPESVIWIEEGGYFGSAGFPRFENGAIVDYLVMEV